MDNDPRFGFHLPQQPPSTPVVPPPAPVPAPVIPPNSTTTRRRNPLDRYLELPVPIPGFHITVPSTPASAIPPTPASTHHAPGFLNQYPGPGLPSSDEEGEDEDEDEDEESGVDQEDVQPNPEEEEERAFLRRIEEHIGEYLQPLSICGLLM